MGSVRGPPQKRMEMAFTTLKWPEGHDPIYLQIHGQHDDPDAKAEACRVFR